MKGNIRVYCRARPLSRDELSRSEQMVAAFSEDSEISLVDPQTSKRKTFELDRVYQPDSTQGIHTTNPETFSPACV